MLAGEGGAALSRVGVFAVELREPRALASRGQLVVPTHFSGLRNVDTRVHPFLCTAHCVLGCCEAADWLWLVVAQPQL